MWLVLIGWLGCQRPEPAPLPPPRRELWQPRGRTVAASNFHGYLVKPQQLPVPAILLLVDTLDDATRKTADDLARGGSVTLAVEAATETERARAYLNNLADTRGVSDRCLRLDGC
jgi:hypothetical protein